MTEHNLAPIELTDDELLAVSGGRTSASAEASISQRISQSVGVAQLGGGVGIGGGNGATTVTNATFSQTFSAVTTTTQSATNSNSGNASATASASSVESQLFSAPWQLCQGALPPEVPAIGHIKPQKPELQITVTRREITATRYGLFRPESIEARRMLWLGRPAVALGLPAALSSIASVVMAAAAVALVTLGSYARRIDLHGLILPSAGLIQVSSPAAGWVQSMLVRDGQTVAAGTPLYLVNTDTANSTGNTQQQILQALASQRAILVDQIARKIELRNLQDATLRRKIENLQAQVRQMDAELAMQDEFVRRVTKNFEDFTRFQQQRSPLCTMCWRNRGTGCALRTKSRGEKATRSACRGS